MKLKPQDLRNLSQEELQDKIANFKKELLQLRFQAKTGKLERQSAIRDVRHNIARIFTVINEKKAEVKA